MSRLFDRLCDVSRDWSRCIDESDDSSRPYRVLTVTNNKGGIVEKEAPIHLSNVMLVDPESTKPTRVGTKQPSEGRRSARFGTAALKTKRPIWL